MAITDPWAKDLGKEITLIQQKPASGTNIDTTNYFDPKAPKSRKIKGKIIGTNGQGNLVIMFDKELLQPPGYQSYVAPPAIAQVAMEYREEVQRAAGKNKFITLSTTHAHTFHIGELPTKEKKTVIIKSKSASDDENMSFFDTFKSDSADAAFRVASDKIAEGARQMIALAIMAKMGDGATREGVEAVLNTPMGKALIQAAAGYALTYLAPARIKTDPRVKRLAKEFRVAGMATAGGFLADGVLDHITPIIESALEMLPGGESSEDSSKVRVTETAPSRTNVVEIAQSEEEDSETEKPSSQRMVAGGSSR